MRKRFILIILVLAQLSCLDQKKQAEIILRHYISSKVDQIRNYNIESRVALWNVTISGKESDYKRMIDIELEFNRASQNAAGAFSPDRLATLSQNVFSNEKDFELLRKLKFSGLITDTLLDRQLNVLYQTFMGSQIEIDKYKKLIMEELKLWQKFLSAGVEFEGKRYGVNDLDSLRKSTNDPFVRKEIADALRENGQKIAPEIIRMVKNRNDFAVQFGYPDFYHLELEMKDQTPEQIRVLLDEIELKTHNKYFEAKRVIDNMLAKRFGVSKNDLAPWFYAEERESYLPRQFTRELDSLFADTNPVKLTADFFNGIGIPIEDVIENSKLEVSPVTKNVTAMVNVDFENDIRLIGGITSSYDGMFRMMHLGGHAAHYKSIASDVPYLLKLPNPVITEGVSRYFEGMATDYEWIKNELPVTGNREKKIVLICRHMQEVDLLFRCRKALAMAEFEREFYRNPDQDLDLLWHNVNLRCLGITFPEKEQSCYWATNRYATLLTCNIQNLILADVFAAQLQHAVETKVLATTNGKFRNNPAVGSYLVKNLFRYGNLLPWEKLIEKATGETLNPKYFVEELGETDRP